MCVRETEIEKDTHMGGGQKTLMEYWREAQRLRAFTAHVEGQSSVEWFSTAYNSSPLPKNQVSSSRHQKYLYIHVHSCAHTHTQAIKN